MQKFYTAYVGIELVQSADDSAREAVHYRNRTSAECRR